MGSSNVASLYFVSYIGHKVITVTFSPTISLPLPISASRSSFLCLSHFLFFSSRALSLSLSPSMPLSLCLSICLSLSLFLSVSLYLALSLPLNFLFVFSSHPLSHFVLTYLHTVFGFLPLLFLFLYRQAQPLGRWFELARLSLIRREYAFMYSKLLRRSNDTGNFVLNVNAKIESKILSKLFRYEMILPIRAVVSPSVRNPELH